MAGKGVQNSKNDSSESAKLFTDCMDALEEGQIEDNNAADAPLINQQERQQERHNNRPAVNLESIPRSGNIHMFWANENLAKL
jgi:hypothetical protein